MKFNKINHCIVCESDKFSNCIFRSMFTNDKLTKFISSYYSISYLNELKDYEFNIYYCESCDFYWQELIPDNQLSYDLYEKWIDADESKKKALRGFALYRNQASSILKSFLHSFPGNVSKFKFLDYGAGWGGWSLLAKELGMSVNSYEISARRILYLENNNINTISNLVPVVKYDLILLNQVLEHVSSISELLNLLNHSLNIEGYLIISVPDCSSIKQEILGGQFQIGKNQLHPIEHLNGFTNNSLTKLMIKHGFYKISLLEGIKLNLNNIDYYLLKRIFSFIYNQIFSTTIIFHKIK